MVDGKRELQENSRAISQYGPLSGIDTERADRLLRELPQSTKLNIRGDSNDPQFAAALLKHSLSLPDAANTLTKNESQQLFWMGPDEWLLRADVVQAELAPALLESLRSLHSAVVDVSDYYTVIRVEGPGRMARDILAKSCPLDFHIAFAKPDSCAQTRIGNAACLLNETGSSKTGSGKTGGGSQLAPDNTAIDIQVRWSYAEYVWQLLEHGI